MSKETPKAEPQKQKFFSVLSGNEVELNEGERIIKVVAKEIDYENKKFLAFSAIKKNGEKTQLKFTKVAKNIPATAGTHHILVSDSDVNIDTWSRTYPVMWCKNVLDLLQIDESQNAEKIQKKKEALNEF